MADPRLHLLHLASPALPIGAYAYSQGLEYAIEHDQLRGQELRDWLADGLALGVAFLDLPIILRVHCALAQGNASALDHWNDLLLANRETRELLLEDQQIGMALLRLLKALQSDFESSLSQKPGYATAFAMACQAWRIDTEAALYAYCFSWLENQVTAATKLVPLGQTEAQTLLLSLFEEVPRACEHAATLEDAAIGLSLPGLALASCGHECQHTRLFRS